MVSVHVQRRPRSFIKALWGSSRSGGDRSGHATYPFMNLIRDVGINEEGLFHRWQFTDVADGSGIPGQGIANPFALPGNHKLIKLAGVCDDPSYGKAYGSLAEVSQGEIGAYWNTDEQDMDETIVGI